MSRSDEKGQLMSGSGTSARRVSTTLLAVLLWAAAGAAGCSIFTVLQFIPTLFAIQSRLEGCPSGAVLRTGQFVQLTYVLVREDQTTEAVTTGLDWSVRDGSADIDDAAVNPVFVELTTPGIVTIRADYTSPSEVANPAICTMVVQAPAEQ